jgi:predicted dehydrogenase
MGFGAAVRAKDDGKSKMTAAIIGHTGRGDYGHGLDQVFNNRENIEVVAIADPVSSGRTAASLRTKAVREYPDYRQMLEREKPRLVSIAPRWTDQHHAMAMAALEIGAHVLMEKPIAQTLAEADEILGKANKSGLKIAVAHQMRLAPNILHLKRRIDQGLLGDLLQIRAYGKQDSRAGGEDMLVLGTHLFDLMRFFGGNASWCSAQVLQNGHEITLLDAHTAKEDIGPIAGNEIEAQFGLEGNVSGSFTSRAKLREQIAHWGLELIGSKSTARILADISPMTFILRAGAWTASGKSDRWERLEDDPTLNATVGETSTELANKRVVDDWLDSIERNREPVCSGRSAMKALEMVMAVYHAGLSRQRVKLPLANRTHPLTVLK